MDKDIKRLNSFIETNFKRLNGCYKRSFEKWITKRDVVCKELNLTEKQILLITAHEVTLRTICVLQEITHSKNNIGVSKAGFVELINSLKANQIELASVCSRFIDLETFDKKIKAINNHSCGKK